MASFTSRIAGWTAGRLKGEKARKKTMNWMQKTGLGQVLGFVGDAALVGGAIKGVGMAKTGLKGLLGVKDAATAGQAAAATGGSLSQYANLPTSLPSAGASAAAPAFVPSAAGQAASSQIAGMAGTGATQAGKMAATSPLSKMLGGAGDAVRGAGQAVRGVGQTIAKTPLIGEGLATTGRTAMKAGSYLAENPELVAYAAPAAAQAIGSSQEARMEEDRIRREQEYRNRLAQLLMPMFQSELEQYGQMYGPMSSYGQSQRG